MSEWNYFMYPKKDPIYPAIWKLASLQQIIVKPSNQLSPYFLKYTSIIHLHYNALMHHSNQNISWNSLQVIYATFRWPIKKTPNNISL